MKTTIEKYDEDFEVDLFYTETVHGVECDMQEHTYFAQFPDDFTQRNMSQQDMHDQFYLEFKQEIYDDFEPGD